MRKKLLSRYMNVQPMLNRTPLVQKMQDHFWQGDEYMDPVIALGRRTSMGKVRTMVLQALSNGIESVPNAPREIMNLFAHLDRKPSWFDGDTYERGRVILANATGVGRLTALAMNFIITSQASSVANAVGSTGQYTNSKTVMRRHLETAHFFHRISLPNGSKRFSETFQEIVKVRFMHSQVRFAARKRWGEDAFSVHGNPISNTDMALGITAFGIQNLIGDSAFGRDFSTSDLDAAVRDWGYIAYVFGVSEDLIPLNFQEGVEQFDYILSTHGKAPKWSPVVADSLLIVPEEAISLVSSPILRGILNWTAIPFFHGLLYYFGGDSLGYRVLSTRYKSRMRMRIQAIFALTLGTIIVTLSTILGYFPGHEARMIARASQGSPTGEVALRLIEMMAKRAGVRGATFETHDTTNANDFKAISI
jgi:hypothetical protein